MFRPLFDNPSLVHSGGSAFRDNGVIYYSPNSNRQVSVPVYDDDSTYRFCQCNTYIENFRSPVWWTRVYGFLAFVPLLPLFSGVAFGCLCNILSTIKERDCGDGTVVYAMLSKHLTAWLELERTLICICSLLWSKFLVAAALAPPAPFFFGLKQTFRLHRAARLCIQACQDWFVMWMGLLSFIISELEVRFQDHEIPDWFAFLVNKGVSQIWLNSFCQSTVT